MYLHRLIRSLGAATLAVAMGVHVITADARAQAQQIVSIDSVIAAVEAYNVEIQAARTTAQADWQRPDQVTWPLPMVEAMFTPWMIGEGRTGVQAQVLPENPAQPLEQIIADALEEHPRIRSARYQEQAATQRIDMARALPAPEVGIGADDVGLTGPGLVGDHAVLEYSIQQRLPWPGKIGARVNVERAGLDVASAQRSDLERQLIADIKQAYVDLWYIQNQIVINRDIQNLLQDFIRSAQRLFEVGGEGLEGILTAEAELARRRSDERVYLNDYGQTLAAFNALRYRDPATPLGYIDTLGVEAVPVIDMQALEQRILMERSDIRAARHVVDVEDAQIHLAQREFFPDIGIEFKTMHPGLLPRQYAAAVTLSLPLAPWAASGVRRRVDEATMRRRSAEQSLEALREIARSELRQAQLEVESTFDRIMLYQNEVLPRSREATRATEAAFRTAQTTYLTVLDSYRLLETLRLEHLRARADFHRAMAELERQIGINPNTLQYR